VTDLSGRVIIVTGAGRGLGRAYAIDAARAGATVVVNDADADEARGVADEITAAGGVAAISGHSVAEADSVDAMVDQAVSAFGHLDGFVANAGRYHEALPWEEDPSAVVADVGVNVLGPIYCVRSASRAMRETAQGSDCSIVLASSSGMRGSRSAMTYCATKGAVASLTFAAALDLADSRIRVNAIAPVAWTRMTRNAIARTFTPAGQGKPLLAGIEDRSPAHVAPLVTYLLSQESAAVTGQFIAFNGERLAVFGQVAFDSDRSSASRSCWTSDEVAAALAGPLAGHLQPFGADRMPPDAASRAS
jgi:NAD(P)-dependent dehydrogenase (short-subunit alcohol dehydrogenase family)